MVIKAYSKFELRQMYGISRDTFNRWLKGVIDTLPHYNPNAKILTPAQVAAIFEAFGEPEIPVKQV